MNYWKIRSLAALAQLTQTQAQQAVEAANRRLNDALVEAGLSPEVPYRFDDATETLRPATDPETLPATK